MRVPGSRSPSRDTAQVLHPLGLAHHDQEDDDDGGGHDGTIGGNEEDDKDDCEPRDHFRDAVQVLLTPPHTLYIAALYFSVAWMVKFIIHAEIQI